MRDSLGALPLAALLQQLRSLPHSYCKTPCPGTATTLPSVALPFRCLPKQVRLIVAVACPRRSVFNLAAHPGVQPGGIALNSIHRKVCRGTAALFPAPS